MQGEEHDIEGGTPLAPGRDIVGLRVAEKISAVLHERPDGGVGPLMKHPPGPGGDRQEGGGLQIDADPLQLHHLPTGRRNQLEGGMDQDHVQGEVHEVQLALPRPIRCDLGQGDHLALGEVDLGLRRVRFPKPIEVDGGDPGTHGPQSRRDRLLPLRMRLPHRKPEPSRGHHTERIRSFYEFPRQNHRLCQNS